MSKDAIGLLIDLARQGEIDPWDIDVVQLTDRFLQSLGKLDASDLPRSGQALFYASVLVSMKAEILEARLQPQPEPYPIDEEYLETQAVARLPLERMLHRRPAVPAMEDRPLTLNDLIAHLKEVEQIERRQVRERPPDRRVSLKGISISTMAEVEELAHHENLEAVVAELSALIARLGPQGDAIPFAYLLEHYQDRVGAFLGLLFLAHRSQVTLAQTDFYCDILVYGIQSEDTA
jgi:segregation and condensation protein A